MITVANVGGKSLVLDWATVEGPAAGLFRLHTVADVGDALSSTPSERPVSGSLRLQSVIGQPEVLLPGRSKQLFVEQVSDSRGSAQRTARLVINTTEGGLAVVPLTSQ